MSSKEEIDDIINGLKELLEESSVPKNIKENIQRVIKTLGEDDEESVRINKALNELDEVADDVNMQPYTRTQIWNIVSMLEKVNS